MLQNMKLSTKLYGGFGIVLSIMVALAVVGVLKIASLNVVVGDLSNTHLPLVDILRSIDSVAVQQELAVTQYALHGDEEYRTEYDKTNTEVDELFAKAEKIIQGDEELVEQGWDRTLREVASAHDHFAGACGQFQQAVTASRTSGGTGAESAATQPGQAGTANRTSQQVDVLADQCGKASDEFMAKLDSLIATNEKEAIHVSDEAANQAKSARLVLAVASTVGLLLGLFLAWSITRGIIRPMRELFKGLTRFSTRELNETGGDFKRIIAGLTESVSQVNDAAGQVATSSQQLAAGASEQASSLEETSSALEEMAAMTRTNASNANQANELAVEARKAADDGEQTMQAISESSDQISKIIKVIEEIAFQTNLLALNAAVEAARAGEHGKGFAVVADEVRNLAQRAAQAAKETTGLIENSVTKSRQGSEAIKGIVGNVAKLTDLIDGIAKASNEQAQGVEQVNVAVSQMDKVTQANAAGAEESASASEELSAQAEAVNGMVGELISLIEGNDGATHTGNTRKKVTKPAPLIGKPRIPAKPEAVRVKTSSDVVAASHAEHSELDKF